VCTISYNFRDKQLEKNESDSSSFYLYSKLIDIIHLDKPIPGAFLSGGIYKVELARRRRSE
jgi:hypothetical protein